MMTYTTRQGDMWDSIAFSQLGSTMFTANLMAINMRYSSLYTFPAGIILNLPKIEEPISNAMPPWKKVTADE